MFSRPFADNDFRRGVLDLADVTYDILAVVVQDDLSHRAIETRGCAAECAMICCVAGGGLKMLQNFIGAIGAALPKVLESATTHLVVLVAGSLIGYFTQPIIRWIKNLRSGLWPYLGPYKGYRWGKAGLVEPNIQLAVTWSGRFVLKWWMPGANKPSIARLYGSLNRETFWIGADYRRAAYSYFVIHPNSYAEIKYLTGIYCFLNDAGSMVAGRFLLARDSVDRQTLEKILPKDLVHSSQDDASGLYEAMFKASTSK